MRYGAVLKACRTRAGLSQEELAEKLHINQSDVSKYENDTKEPSMSIFQSWATNTQAQEVLIAFTCGMDGLSILQNMAQIVGLGAALISGLLLL
ncbi:helix-turn-helix domain-containing protein [Radiobacillus kanasensis]|uniref:helix-turn-helix domain-containing protein n=1 Tax=Radiobacillus kanasensis TaxID=2844358 RepID=UPI0038B69EA4